MESKVKIFIATDFRVTKYDNRFYLASQHYHIIERYFNAFGEIVLCARVLNKAPTDKLIEATQFLDKVIEVPGLVAALKPSFSKKIRNDLKECRLFVARFPSIIACAAYKEAKKCGMPVFAELMGDVWDGLWNHGIVGKMIAPYMFLRTKSIVKNSDYALYVTTTFLQKRYPCINESVAASNVLINEISEEALECRLKKISAMLKSDISLMTTAAVNVKYKGQMYVIRAIPKLNKLGIRVKYYVVGGGEQNYLRSLAEKKGVLDQVIFTGRLSLQEVFSQIDAVDIYIQPSLQEGLPRSVIEAMSRGCPCIGARTAGIPELIEDRFVVKRKSVNDIVDKVKMFCDMPTEERKEVAIRNFDEAKKYAEDVLNKRRNEYYAKVKKDLEG